jgi:hypothetical protein
MLVGENRGDVLLEIEDDCISQEVESGGTASQECPPPPMVVLGTQVEIAQQDAALHRRAAQNHKHSKQEAEHVVQLLTPAHPIPHLITIRELNGRCIGA